jgi:hypothetical protein
MFKPRNTIILIILSAVFLLQVFRLHNIKYEYGTQYCENGKKVDFRIIDMLILNNNKKVLELPPGNWVFHFFTAVENTYYYKIEISDVSKNGYSNSTLHNISSDFDLTKLTKYNDKLCLTPTLNDNLIAVGHYSEIILKNN